MSDTPEPPCPTNHRAPDGTRWVDPGRFWYRYKFCPDCGVRLTDTREGPQSPSVQDLLDADVTGSGVIMSDEFFDDSTMDAAKGER